jgi:hypothetical protein
MLRSMRRTDSTGKRISRPLPYSESGRSSVGPRDGLQPAAGLEITEHVKAAGAGFDFLQCHDVRIQFGEHLHDAPGHAAAIAPDAPVYVV